VHLKLHFHQILPYGDSVFFVRKKFLDGASLGRIDCNIYLREWQFQQSLGVMTQVHYLVGLNGRYLLVLLNVVPNL
jgi:hypothetical protein